MVQRTTRPCPCPTINPPSACPSSSIHHQLIMFHWPKTRTEGEAFFFWPRPLWNFKALTLSNCPNNWVTDRLDMAQLYHSASKGHVLLIQGIPVSISKKTFTSNVMEEYNNTKAQVVFLVHVSLLFFYLSLFCWSNAFIVVLLAY